MMLLTHPMQLNVSGVSNSKKPKYLSSGIFVGVLLIMTFCNVKSETNMTTTTTVIGQNVTSPTVEEIYDSFVK